MISQKTIAPLLTPAMGMMPAIAFFLFNSFFPYNIALVAALIVYVLYFAIGGAWLKYETPFTILNSAISFFLFIAFSFLAPFNVLYLTKASVFFSFFLVLVFFVFIKIQGYFKMKILLNEDSSQEFKLLKFDSEIQLMKIVLYTQVAYLLVVLLYELLPSNYHEDSVDFIVYHAVVLIFIFFHLLYEIIHWNILRKKILNEEWLPIVDEKGGVHGRVALSVSQSAGDKYLHPVVRIALIHKGRLFLKERSSFPINESHQLDYPFERYLRFEETLDEGVKEAFIEKGVTIDLPYRFIFHYVSKNRETNRLIYLYVCNILDENIINDFNIGEGKWWTGKQIDENLGTGLFSPYFEKEYELLNTTVLMADRLMRDLEES